MSEPTAYPPLGCRGRLVDPKTIGSIRPATVDYAFMGEPILFGCQWAGKLNLMAYKLNSPLYGGIYLLSVVTRWPDELVVYDYLRQSECYLALVDDFGEEPTWNVTKIWRVDFDTIPRDLLPPPGYRPLESSW